MLGLVAGDPCPNNELLTAGLEKGYAVYDDTMGRRADVKSLFKQLTITCVQDVFMLTQVKKIDMRATGKLYNNASNTLFGINCF